MGFRMLGMPFGNLGAPIGSGLGSNGVPNYISRVKGLFGSSIIQNIPMNEPAGADYLTLNGTTSLVNFGSAASLDDLHDGEFTVEAWVYALNTTAAILGKGFNGTGNGWTLFVSGTGTPFFRVNCATTDSTGAGASSIVGGWHHVVGYFNDAGGVDRKSYISVDGVWGSVGVLASGAIETDAGTDLKSGILSAAAAWRLSGSVGWMRISNNDRYNHGVNFTPPARTTIPAVDANTVLLTPMNEGYGAVAGDLSANNNDGTITGGDWPAYPVAQDISGQGNNGIYTGVKLGNMALPAKIGGYAPYFDGLNDYNNVYSVGLNTAFDPTKLTLSIWARISAAGVWADGVVRYLVIISADSNNAIRIYKAGAVNTLYLDYKAGGITKTGVYSGSNTGWVHFCITADVAGDAVKSYVNGSQLGLTLTGLGVWAGALTNTACVIGAISSITGNNPYSGWLAHHLLLNKVATPDEVAQLYAWGA